jgi:VCBS repeat-containing protein
MCKNSVSGNPMTVVLDSAPVHGTLIVNSEGTWTYRPDGTYAGADYLGYRINDGMANSRPGMVSFTVQAANLASVAQNGAASAMANGSHITNFADFGTDSGSKPLTGMITAEPKSTDLARRSR